MTKKKRAETTAGTGPDKLPAPASETTEGYGVLISDDPASEVGAFENLREAEIKAAKADRDEVDRRAEELLFPAVPDPELAAARDALLEVLGHAPGPVGAPADDEAPSSGVTGIDAAAGVITLDTAPAAAVPPPPDLEVGTFERLTDHELSVAEQAIDDAERRFHERMAAARRVDDPPGEPGAGAAAPVEDRDLRETPPAPARPPGLQSVVALRELAGAGPMAPATPAAAAHFAAELAAAEAPAELSVLDQVLELVDAMALRFSAGRDPRLADIRTLRNQIAALG